MTFFSNEEIEYLLEIKKKSDERIKCLKNMINHEEQSQLYLRPILAKYCKHEWRDEGSSSVENNSYDWRCSKCSLLKTFCEELGVLQDNIGGNSQSS